MVVTVVLCDGVPVAESDENKPDVILDYDDLGNLVALEILAASKRVTDARRVEFQLTELGSPEGSPGPVGGAYATAHSCDSTSACSRTVCVAFSCLSGG